MGSQPVCVRRYIVVREICNDWVEGASHASHYAISLAQAIEPKRNQVIG